MKTIGGFWQDRRGVIIVDIHNNEILRLDAIGGYTSWYRRCQARMLILLQKVGVV